ncbi:MAG: hypothetical protein WD883_02330 [Candidatus Colwellbacteria bacterium]
MRIKQITVALVALAIFALPVVAFANTYQFVDNNDNLQSMTADSSTEALNTAPNLGVHSGVMLVSGGTGGAVLGSSFTSENSGDNYYQFVDSNGNIQGIYADSFAEALANANNLGLHSGVALYSGGELLE